MKRVALFLLTLFFPLSFWGYGTSTEKIDNFKIAARIHEDSSFSVTEEIEYNFGSRRRRGIFRDIPVHLYRKVDTGFGTVRANYTVSVDVQSVTDQNDRPYTYKLMRKGGDLRIRIGTPSKYITGTKVYKIKYRVRRAINEFENHDEFYWNFIGTRWEVPILKVSVDVKFPTESLPAEFKHKSVTGRYGSTNQVKYADFDGSTYTIQQGLLRPGQATTAIFSFPKGYLNRPSVVTKFFWFLKDNVLTIMFILLPFLVFGFFYWTYLTRGRDPEDDHPVMVEYFTPEDILPAEAGTLLDEVAHNSDIVATVVTLATKGYIKISAIESESFLFFSSKDYQFTQTKSTWQDLSPYEQTLMASIFAAGGGDSVLLSELKEKFYKYVPGLKSQLYNSLVDKGLFNESPDSVRSRYLLIGSAMIVVFIGGLAFLSQFSVQSFNVPYAVFSGIASLAIVFICHRWIPRKTLKGSRSLRKLKGLKEFIERVEQDKIKRLHDEDPTVFGKILPFAMVMGCADHWADKFDGLLTEPPDWYDSPYYHSRGMRFHSRDFVSEIGEGLHTMEKTFVSQPQSSGSGGSSGFGGGGFGGGGFSGGGFGGGGGGSW